MPSKARNSRPPAPHSGRRKSPKSGPTSTSHHYLVVDTTFPSHIFNDRSLFTTYTPSRKVHQTNFGSTITIEGTGDVRVRVIVKGVSTPFLLRDCWHVPCSHNHFFSSLATISRGNQIMLAGRTPRMILPHKNRLLEPRLPKYLPFTRVGGLFVLKFDIPVLASTPITKPTTAVPHTTRPLSHPTVSLHASSSPHFAALSFYPHSFPPTLPVPQPDFHGPSSNSLSTPHALFPKPQQPHLRYPPLPPTHQDGIESRIRVGVDVGHWGAYAQLDKGACSEPNGSADVLLRGIPISPITSPASIAQSSPSQFQPTMPVLTPETPSQAQTLFPTFTPDLNTTPRTLAVPLSTFIYQPVRTPLLSLEVTNDQRGLNGLIPAPTTHPPRSQPHLPTCSHR